ncbi:hypothetical protein GCM10022227_14040 [Streptomyces sedi]
MPAGGAERLAHLGPDVGVAAPVLLDAVGADLEQEADALHGALLVKGFMRVGASMGRGARGVKGRRRGRAHARRREEVRGERLRDRAVPLTALGAGS